MFKIYRRFLIAALFACICQPAHAAVRCQRTDTTIPVLLIENKNELKIEASQNSAYVNWVEFMNHRPTNMTNDIHHKDIYLYTSFIMNFLELNALFQWQKDSHDLNSMFETRMGLFFLQLQQSKALGDLWSQLVEQGIEKTEHSYYLGNFSIKTILDYFSQRYRLQEYFENLSNLVIQMGTTLHEANKSTKYVDFRLIQAIAASPTHQHSQWQTLLQQLVRWQFESTQDILKKYYCIAVNQGLDVLIVKIPPTPLLEFYIEQFDEWGRNNKINVNVNF